MQAAKPSSKQAPKWGRGMSFTLESPELKAFKVLERKPSLKEKRDEEQLVKLQEELKKAKEEKTRVLEELEELKRHRAIIPPNDGIMNLEKEVEKAKESERKMLASLITQTKQLGQTKILLEEAKLETRSLQETIKSLELTKLHNSKGLAKSQSDRNLAKLDDPLDADAIRAVAKELKLATEAEEKSKKAMDGLALALKEVSTEANRAKARLSTSQTQLERAKLNADRSNAMLKIAEEKLQAAEDEAKRLKSEMEDSAAMWNEKESGFINCMKLSEEEISKLECTNQKLMDSLRISRDDNSKLRDILKQAVNEATAAKEALEIARDENSKLKDLVSEKESAYQRVRQEYECLKVSEAAAVGSVKELKGFLAATSNMDYPNADYSIRSPVNFNANESARTTNSNGRHSHGGLGRLTRSRFDSKEPVSSSRDTKTLSSDESAYIDWTLLHGKSMSARDSSAEQKKKPVLKRLGEMLRRKSFHK